MYLTRITVFFIKSSIILSIVLLVMTSLSTLSLATCVDYQTQVDQAVQAKDFNRLESLLATLEKQSDCSNDYLNWIKRSMAQIAAGKADTLTQQSNLAQAEKWLKRAPTMIWATQVVYGDIAAYRKQWQIAANFYNQVLDLIADPQITPQSPPETVIEKIYDLASQTQVLAGNLDATISRSGQASGIMRNNVRGFKPQKRLIPILFDFGKNEISKKGKRAANQLVTYLKRHGFSKVILIGHTDSVGSHQVNDRLSKRRASALKAYLQKSGITAKIYTIGKGKREPLQLDNQNNYTQAEIDALNRRVEFEAE